MRESLAALKTAASTMLLFLTDQHQEARDAGLNLTRARGLLRGALESLVNQDRQLTGVSAAKAACEEIADLASEAEADGAEDFAELLIDELNKLSPHVARLLPFLNRRK